MLIMGVPPILALLGLFCGYFALGLGRDPYRWFLLGSLLGPVGFLVFFMPTLQRINLQCPACNQTVRTDDSFCRYCGYPLEDPPAGDLD